MTETTTAPASPARGNRFLEHLRARPTACQVGLWCSIPSPVAAEICAGSGFDWMLFDMEHAPADIKDIYAALQATSAYPVSPIVRPPSNDAVAIKRLLDIGARNLLIPFVQTADEARAAVAAASYPPHGTRGLTLSSRANGFGRDGAYLHQGARDIGVIVQIETRSALDRLGEIARVPGVAAVFFGPSDLSADMGHLGNPASVEVRDTIVEAAKMLQQMDMPWGILVGSPEAADFYASRGAAFVAAGADQGLLRKASDDLAERLRRGVASAR